MIAKARRARAGDDYFFFFAGRFFVFGGPEDTTKLTREPAASVCPGPGLVEIT